MREICFLFFLIITVYSDQAFIRKCCNINESLVEDECAPTDIDFNEAFEKLFNEPVSNVDVIIGNSCQYGRYRLEPQNDKNDEFVLLKDGFLDIPAVDEPPINPMDYCIESFKLEDGTIAVLPLICFPPPQAQPFWKTLTEILFPLGCMTSIPFLIMVIFVFLGISELKDTYGKVVANHCLCLAISYFALVVVKLFGGSLNEQFCIAFAYIMQFSFLSCFIWLNILCYHTWKKLTSMYRKRLRFMTSRKEKKLFIKYNIFAWGIPTIILCVTVIMDYSPTVPSTFLKPNLGVEACWFKDNKSVIPYFYGPISLLLMINVVYFIMTARFLHKNRKTSETPEIKHMGDAVNAVIKKRRETMFIKCLMLFCMMGLNWILEVLSWFVGGPPQLWLLTDIINTLQGPILFWAFVYNDVRVRRCAKNKYCQSCVQKRSKQEQSLMIELPEIVSKA